MSILTQKPTHEQITWAEAHGACREGKAAARAGATFGELKPDHRGWAARLPGLTYEQRRELIAASDTPAHWRGMCATYTPGLTDEQCAELKEAK